MRKVRRGGSNGMGIKSGSFRHVVRLQWVESKGLRVDDPYGGLVGFELKGGGKEAGQKFIDALKMFYHVANIGDSRSLMTHPASTTHSGLDEAVREEMGIDESMLRINVGLEDPQDLIEDLDGALKAVGL